MLRDLRQAVRLTWRRPGGALVVIAVLALGIGANTAIFSVVNGLLIRRLPYPEPERLALVWETLERDGQLVRMGPGDLLQYRARSLTVESMAALTDLADAVLTGQDQPQLLYAFNASPSLFTLLGARPFLGRLFAPAEEDPGSTPVVVLGYDFWSNGMGADPHVIGRNLTIGGHAYAVIGVVSPDFLFPPPITYGDRIFSSRSTPDIWLPLTIDPANPVGPHALFTVARLRAGVTAAQAEADLGAIASRMNETNPNQHTGFGVSVVDLQAQAVMTVRPALVLLLMAVGIVLCVACGNVANLLLASAASRRSEMALRTAIGATRGDLVRLVAAEGVLLAVAGGGLGLSFAVIAAPMVASAVPLDLPPMFTATPDARVMAFCLATTIGTVLIFGTVPAFYASRTDPIDNLRGGQGGQRTPLRLRRLFIVGQMAMTTALMVAGGLLMRSFSAIRGIDPGLGAGAALTFGVNLPADTYPGSEEQRAFVLAAEDRFTGVPGVAVAGATDALPLTTDRVRGRYGVEGERQPTPGELQLVDMRQTTSGFYGAMGIEVVAGRTFHRAEVETEASVVIINETLARRHWGMPANAVGRRLSFNPGADSPDWFTVVGVAHDVRERGVLVEPGATIYRPLSNSIRRRFWFALQPETGSASAVNVSDVREALWSLDASLALRDPQPVSDRIASSIEQPRLVTVVVVTFGAAALLLAVIGLYGVMGWTVNEQIGVIGIRMALGATPGTVLRHYLRDALVWCLAGLGIGLAAAIVIAHVMRGFVYGVQPADPVTVVVVGAALLAAGAATAYVPARRATRTDPASALRLG